MCAAFVGMVLALANVVTGRMFASRTITKRTFTGDLPDILKTWDLPYVTRLTTKRGTLRDVEGVVAYVECPSSRCKQKARKRRPHALQIGVMRRVGTMIVQEVCTECRKKVMAIHGAHFTAAAHKREIATGHASLFGVPSASDAAPPLKKTKTEQLKESIDALAHENLTMTRSI